MSNPVKSGSFTSATSYTTVLLPITSPFASNAVTFIDLCPFTNPLISLSGACVLPPSLQSYVYNMFQFIAYVYFATSLTFVKWLVSNFMFWIFIDVTVAAVS